MTSVTASKSTTPRYSSRSAGDRGAAVAVGEHRVQRVVQRGAPVDGDQVLARRRRWTCRRVSWRSHGQAVGRSRSSQHDHGVRRRRASARAIDLGGRLADRRGGRRRASSTSRTRVRFSRLSAAPAPTKSATKSSAGLARIASGGVVLGDLRALPQDQDPVAELDRLVEVVGDADDRLAQLVLDAEQLVLEPLPGDRVDGAERLVHQHHGRVGGEAAGDADPLLLAAGELARVAAAVLARVEADQLEQLLDPAR